MLSIGKDVEELECAGERDIYIVASRKAAEHNTSALVKHDDIVSQRFFVSNRYPRAIE